MNLLDGKKLAFTDVEAHTVLVVDDAPGYGQAA